MTELPPNDLKSEWILVACCAETPEICECLSADLFYDGDAREVWEFVKGLPDDKKEFAALEVLRSVSDQKRTMFAQGQVDMPAASMWQYYRDICAGLARNREALRLNLTLRDAAMAGDAAAMADIARALHELAAKTQSGGVQPVGDKVDVVIQRLEDAYQAGGRITGIQTGLARLDRHLDGLQNCRLYTVGARPGVGKSSLLQQMALSIAKGKTPVVFISLEMPCEEITERLCQIESQVSARHISTCGVSEAEFKRMALAFALAKKLPVYVADKAFALHRICGEIGRAVRERGCKVAFVDYLQLVRVEGHKGNRVEEVSLVSATLKQLAMQLQIPVVCAAQLNRASEKENRRPVLSDLRDSGSIEQDSDVVLFLTPKGDKLSDRILPVELSIQKARNGGTGLIDLTFTRETTSFTEVGVC